MERAELLAISSDNVSTASAPSTPVSSQFVLRNRVDRFRERHSDPEVTFDASAAWDFMYEVAAGVDLSTRIPRTREDPR
jgi:hypothetical protein